MSELKKIMRLLGIPAMNKPLRFSRAPGEGSLSITSGSGSFKKKKAQSGLLAHDTALAASEQFIQSVAPYPGNFENKGIVICAGGIRLFTSAWVCVNMLRKSGCALPVQIWHLGGLELDARMKALVAPLGVECVDALELRKTIPARILRGWELKAYALLHSPYKEVLLLDADNVPVVNPGFLFETHPYKETGAIFWPDIGRLQKERTIWKLCGVPYRDEPEFESGQMLVNKEKCWKALKLAMWYNEHSDFYYRHIHGDKETFHLAFRKMEKTCSMPEHPVLLKQGVMYQHDFEGNVIFQHRNGPKWNYHSGNPKLPGFKYEKECFDFIEQLKEKWNGVIGLDDVRMSETIRKAAAALTSRTYIYKRIGYDQRPMTFLSNGKIGAGNGGCEQLWKLSETRGKARLEIFSEKELTCLLHAENDNVWKGKWLVHEKMPVEIVPAK